MDTVISLKARTAAVIRHLRAIEDQMNAMYHQASQAGLEADAILLDKTIERLVAIKLTLGEYLHA